MAETNYVKFLRGTPAAYGKTSKDSDTLYFVIAENQTGPEKVGALYLGDILIAGNLDASGNSVIDTLAELKDVDLTDKTDKKVLGYNAETQKWEPMTVAEAMGSSIIKETQIFEISIDKDKDHIAAIDTVTKDEDISLQKGDIAIVKENIVSGETTHIEYTSYVYNGINWAAMDGNYSAENVYLSKNISFAGDYTAIGNYKKGGESLKAGTSLQAILSGLLEKELYPEATKPGASVATSGGVGEVGTSYEPPTATLTTTVGSYTYGPATGCTFLAGQVTLAEAENGDGVVSAANKVSNESIMANNSKITLKAAGANGTYGDTAKSYKFTAKATYTDGAVPKTNLGNDYSSKQIKSATITTNTATATFTGYRNNYVYIGEELSEIDSAWIRSKATAKGTASLSATYTIPKGTKRVMFSLPGTHTLVDCIDVDGMGLSVKDNFTISTIAVEGANSYAAKDYTVIVCENANGLEATRYAVSIN